MYRCLLCLPLCLCMGSDHRDQKAAPKAQSADGSAVADNGDKLPTKAEMERLAKKAPVAFLENCLRRYDREVKGYHAVMEKQERIGGKLNPKEVIDVWFRQKPFSVCMIWREGARLAERVVYVKGENKHMMLARPAGKAARFFVGNVVSRDPEGADARQSGRITVNHFGMKKGTERLLKAWKDDPKARGLKIDYLGIKKVKELDDRPCFVFHSAANKPDADGISSATIYVDTETWLQTGSVLKDQKGELVGSYFFRDVQLNPKFKKDQFKRAALLP